LDIKNPTKAEEEKQYNTFDLIEMLDASFDKSHKLLNQLKQAVK
jgi:type I restriction enzyme M protein